MTLKYIIKKINYMASLKEIAIREYLSNIDFNRDDWKLSNIKKDMRVLLGEEPGVDIIYKKDVILNEVLGEAQEISKVNKVSVVFTDLDDKFKKIEFIID
jgi:hypothetical protein